jgi:predicted DCC family thiol-disulfide oxidoreductase YuxK
MTASKLTLYFDGRCAFCATEMQRLARWDGAGRLTFCDIAKPGFDPTPLGVDLPALNRELHGLTNDGHLLVGVHCLLMAYSLAGRGWLVWPLRFRLFRRMLAPCYRLFARHRYRISRWLGYRQPATCSDGLCHIGTFPGA